MIAILDYGVGNLFSLRSSLDAVGKNAVVTRDPDTARAADRLILPGVGAFAQAARKLKDSGLHRVLFDAASQGKPILGICLGMQLLFDKSYEYGPHEGLGLIPGTVRPIADVVPPGLKIPHMGWNELTFQPHPLFAALSPGDCVYFVHSFYADTPYAIATAEYGVPLTAAAARGSVMGCQFHPEKSGTVGLHILRAFCEGDFVC